MRGELMQDEKKILFVVGSPKGSLSVSNTLAEFLAEKTAVAPSQPEIVHLALSRKTPDSYERLLTSMMEADVLAFVFPLYADQLPSGMVETLERYEEFRAQRHISKEQAVTAVVNCGFPEPEHNDGALAVLKRFTELLGLQWLGGLTLGGGGIVESGKSLASQGGRVYRIARALSLAAPSIAKGIALPVEAQRLMRKSMIPHFLYRWMANWGFLQSAQKWGLSKRQLSAKPFLRADSAATSKT